MLRSWTGYKDELAWAGLWLFKATGSQEYLDKALEMYDDCCSYNNGGAFSWDSKGAHADTHVYVDIVYLVPLSSIIPAPDGRAATGLGQSESRPLPCPCPA